MSNDSIAFNRFDQITSRPNFSLDVEITEKSFRSLIGRYHLADRVVCQVRTERGICHQKHQVGYLGVDDQGIEGLIGGDCGDKYFKEHTIFGFEKNRIDAEIERRENLQRLLSYKKDFFVWAEKHTALKKEVTAIQQKVNVVYQGMPNIVLLFIYNAQKTKNWNLLVDVLRHSKAKNKMTSKWHIETLCTFSPFPTAQEIQSLLGKIENISSLFSEVCSLDIENLPTPKLKYYANKLSEWSDIENATEKNHKDLVKFISIESLENLYYVCSSTKDKYETIKTILKSSGHNNLDELKIKTFEKKIETKTNLKFDGCTVKQNKNSIKYAKGSF
ncbi:hypothetical protein ACCY16_14585 [Candidatus Pantoea formicae]|uniref:hypothetical protein n=1 Tax=Candidatus Pantoea formicae TaxID=2608355 RepID=UPI003EDB16EF